MSKNEFNLLPPNASANDQKNANFLVDGLEREVNLSTLPLEANSSLLPHLAIAYGVDISGLTDGEARAYLNNAFEIHRHKGTVYAVKKAIAVMFSNAELKEWFDNNLTAGLFDVEVTISTDPTKKYSAERFKTAKRLIDDAKNVRCHLNGFTVKMPQSLYEVELYSGCNIDTRLDSEIAPFEAITKPIIGGAIVWNF